MKVSEKVGRNNILKVLMRLENCCKCHTRQDELGKKVGILKLRLWRCSGIAEVNWKTESLEVRG